MQVHASKSSTSTCFASPTLQVEITTASSGSSNWERRFELGITSHSIADKHAFDRPVVDDHLAMLLKWYCEHTCMLGCSYFFVECTSRTVSRIVTIIWRSTHRLTSRTYTIIAVHSRTRKIHVALSESIASLQVGWCFSLLFEIQLMVWHFCLVN